MGFGDTQTHFSVDFTPHELGQLDTRVKSQKALSLRQRRSPGRGIEHLGLAPRVIAHLEHTFGVIMGRDEFEDSVNKKGNLPQSHFSDDFRPQYLGQSLTTVKSQKASLVGHLSSPGRGMEHLSLAPLATAHFLQSS
jgi:hypothetical protein